MRSLILSTATGAYAPRRFEEEASKVSECIHLDWSNLIYDFDEIDGISKLDIYSLNETKLKNFDFVIWRSPGLRLFPHCNIIFKELSDRGRFVLNKESYHVEFGDYNKLAQHYYLMKRNVPIIPSIIYTGKRIPKDLVDRKIGFPLVFKGIRGGLGEQVQKINNWEELSEKMRNLGDVKPGNFFLQKLIDIHFDYRIIVLNKKILGAIRRYNTEKDFRTNVAKGGKVEAVENISPELAITAIRAASAVNAELCGVDIVSLNDKLYVFECNISCQFEGFEKETGVNVAEKVVKYCVERALNVR